MGRVVGATFAYPAEEFQQRAMVAAKDVFRDVEGSEAARAFLAQIHEDAIAEDLEEIGIDDMVHLAARMWAWSGERKIGETMLRLEPGVGSDGRKLRRDVLEIVTDDKPFLVDSVMGEISDKGVGILAMFHPLADVLRDADGHRSQAGEPVRESMIQVHLESLEDETRKELVAAVAATLDDVNVVVSDFGDMRARMDRAIDDLLKAKIASSDDELEECVAFLRWMRDDHFAFFGARVYEFATHPDGTLMQEEPEILVETGRGVLRDPNRHVLRRGSEPTILTPAIQEFLREPSPLIVAKSNMRSRIHRRVYMDYIGVKRYRENGEVIGETRFVGLFTADAYSTHASEVPLIRRKVRRVIERADKPANSHSYKQLKHIIESYPRDELFQSEEDELLEISLGILHLNDRPRPKLFIRRDRFDRFLSAFVFIPRERYNSRIRVTVGELLAEAYDGRLSAFYPKFGDGPLARVHFIIGLNPFKHPEPDPVELERLITELSRTWEDDFIRIARRDAPESLRPMVACYEHAFTAGYREAFDPEEALRDAAAIEAIDPQLGIGVRAYRRPGDAPDEFRFKLYHVGDAISLSDVMPSLEHMALHVLTESNYAVRRQRRASGVDAASLPTVWIHDFLMRFEGGALNFDVAEPAFEHAFAATWSGWNESDGFNALILKLGIGWREVCFLRTCAKYRLQTGLDPSQLAQEQAMAENPEIVRLILELMDVRLNPRRKGGLKDRRKAQTEIETQLTAALESVASIDHDRALRRIARLVSAIQRTNYYQRDDAGAPKRAIAIKIASQEIEELPAPKPFREIFVWSPQVEGVHIRFGPVARGGLRWSDRRDDFRTEVLGLVKAQVVKNAVIVPVGAKGGFYPKQLPRGGSREEIQEAGIAAYTTFISSLLEITDNIVDDKIAHPKDVVNWDGEDPYLVVAADKGTATFSDIANGISENHGFWLGDAFASGGSAGYDHKKMAITARGGWEAVKRHFREMGKDIQTQPFTVVGVGDMSGDVFGNGMLLSRHIRLIAAFDHRDIFIDPNPSDPEVAWNERKRLFDLGRSSWQDYDTSLISKGGGVFSRHVKSIPLTPEIKKLTGLTDDKAAPGDLIRALLASKCELLWFGGIGTYIKSATEQHWQVGDKANDSIRVDAKDVRAKVIGEGANLGLTQAGRIELGRKGVRLNADFIDNAAGVDSSDHEVNIKILLNPMMRSGAMRREERNKLLESMTEDVARHVLKHNYDQTLAITIAETTAKEDLDAHERLIERLEARGKLNRKVEGLPSAEDFRALKEQGLGLTRPELSVLVSYAKIALFDRILESSVPDDPHFDRILTSYFPTALHQYSDDMKNLRLRREIVATMIANDLVNLGGATFTHRARESTGADTDTVARGFEAARSVFGFPQLLERIHALDNKVSAEVQTSLYREIIRLLRRQTYWLVRRGRGFEMTEPRPLDEIIAAYRPGVELLRARSNELVSSYEREKADERAAAFIKAGAPEDLARVVADLRPLTSSSDVIDLGARRNWPIEAAARVYHRVGETFRFDQMRGAAGELSSPLHWDRLAVRRLIEDFYAEQQRVADAVMALAEESVTGAPATAFKSVDADWASAAIEAWADRNAYEVDRVRETLDELSDSGTWTLSKLAIAATSLREFAGLSNA